MLCGCQVAVQLRPVLQSQTQRVASPIKFTGGKADKVFQATWMSLSDEC